MLKIGEFEKRCMGDLLLLRVDSLQRPVEWRNKKGTKIHINIIRNEKGQTKSTSKI